MPSRTTTPLTIGRRKGRCGSEVATERRSWYSTHETVVEAPSIVQFGEEPQKEN